MYVKYLLSNETNADQGSEIWRITNKILCSEVSYRYIAEYIYDGKKINIHCSI